MVLFCKTRRVFADNNHKLFDIFWKMVLCSKYVETIPPPLCTAAPGGRRWRRHLGYFLKIYNMLTKGQSMFSKSSQIQPFKITPVNKGRKLPAFANFVEPSGLAMVSSRVFSRTYPCACFEASEVAENQNPPNDERRLLYTGLCLTLG
jgi:hypothetical protein